jgi:glycosyltransferase involved in cell wall biosynthesis
LSAVSQVKKNIREFKPDVINLHYVVPTGLAAIAGKLSSGIPLVVTYNGRDIPGPGIPPFWKYWNRFVANFADEVTFVSKYCRDAVFGEGSARGVITYNGVNIPQGPLPDKEQEKKKLGLREDQRMIFSLGRLDKIKRVDVLIRAMVALKEKHPDLVLFIAGQGPEREGLEKLIEKLGLQDSVKLLGFVPSSEMDGYFAASEFFVFHSQFETFGIVLAEAMSRGKACVSVNNTAIPEVALEGECALLAKTMDASDMAEKIDKLLVDVELRHRFEKNGQERVKELFDWENIAVKYENVFRKVVKT